MIIFINGGENFKVVKKIIFLRVVGYIKCIRNVVFFSELFSVDLVVFWFWLV